MPILLKLIDDCDEDDHAATEGPLDDNGMGVDVGGVSDDPSYSYLSETMDDRRTIVAGGFAPEDSRDSLLSPTATMGGGPVGSTGGGTVKTSPNPGPGPSSSSMTMTSMADADSIAGMNCSFLEHPSYPTIPLISHTHHTLKTAARAGAGHSADVMCFLAHNIGAKWSFPSPTAAAVVAEENERKNSKSGGFSN